jgi:hypothetical protein
MIDIIVEQIKDKFIENLDEGLLLQPPLYQEFTEENMNLSKFDYNELKEIYEVVKVHGWNKKYTEKFYNKSNPLLYLIIKILDGTYTSININKDYLRDFDLLRLIIINNIEFLLQDHNSKEHSKLYNEVFMMVMPSYATIWNDHNNFKSKLDWELKEKTKFYKKLNDSIKKTFAPDFQILNSIINNVTEVLKAEEILKQDIFYVNVGYRSYNFEGRYSYHPKLFDEFYVRNKSKSFYFIKKSDCKGIKATYADIFIISARYFIKLTLGENGIIDRTQHILARDIKKTNIVDNNKLEIYFHGLYDPETIIMDDYKSALDLQKHLTDLRQVRFDNKRHDR